MPTGPHHHKLIPTENEGSYDAYDCRCMIGEDHEIDADFGLEGGRGGESLSVWDAADIWLSYGKDEDYTFGYSAAELEAAAAAD